MFNRRPHTKFPDSRLVENDLKPWRKKMWCIPQVDAEYVARMEDVLGPMPRSREVDPGFGTGRLVGAEPFPS